MNELPATLQGSFERRYELRPSDFDRYDRILPTSVLELFQDAAGKHAALLGLGRGDLLTRELVWIAVRIRYQVKKDVTPESAVTVRTWPVGPGRVIFQRDYAVLDETGDEAILGSSEWVLMHPVLRKIMPVRDPCPDGASAAARRCFPAPFRHIPVFEPDGSLTLTPGYSQIDVNGHVNNAKYANFVLDAASPRPDEPIRGFMIEYHREVLAGEPLTVSVARQGGEILAAGTSETGEKRFSCLLLTGPGAEV
ncbi:MAG: hypothetical protein IJL69_03170 [Oscillospiraceae bacterium]|nr:hypothetical protein [Oscillospiraceae bacterium]